MTDKLPPNLLALFAPRPPLRYLPHCDYEPSKRRTMPISGVAAFLEEFRKPDPNYVPTESWLQKCDRLQLEKKEKQERRIKEGLENYKPDTDPQIRGDAFKTLFVARLSYDVKEPDLEREFGRFGPIERIRIVRDKNTNKHKGYAFIVYEREKDMKAAYKETDGLRIKDRRVLVDVERGRTVKGWKPRRLGGGLGGRGYTKTPVVRPAGPGPMGFGGDRFGDRGRGGGGFRGGFRGGRGGGFSGGGGDRFGAGGGGGRGPRGGIGYQGGGGFGGDRSGGGGFNPSAEGMPNAPTGPGGRRGGGYQGSGGPGGYSGGGDGGRGGYGGDRDRGYGDRGDRGGSRGGDRGYDRDSRGPRGGGGDRYGDDRRYGGHRDDRDDGGYQRKRPHDDGAHGGGGDRHRRRY